FMIQGLNFAHAKLFTKKRTFKESQLGIQTRGNYSTIHAVVTLVRTMVLSITCWGRYSVLHTPAGIESALALFKFLEKVGSKQYPDDVELVSRLLLHEKWKSDYLFENPGMWKSDPDRYLISW